MTNPLLTKLGIKTKEPSFLKNVNTQQLIAKDTIKKNSTPTFNFFTKNRAGKKIRDVADTVSSAYNYPITYATKGRSEAVNKMRSKSPWFNAGQTFLNTLVYAQPLSGGLRRGTVKVLKSAIPDKLYKKILLGTGITAFAGDLASNPKDKLTKYETVGGNVANLGKNIFNVGKNKDIDSVKKLFKENPVGAGTLLGLGLVGVGAGAYGTYRALDAMSKIGDKPPYKPDNNSSELTKDDIEKLLRDNKNPAPVGGSEVISENTSENTQPSFLNEPSTGTNNTPVTPVTEDLTTQPQVRKKRKSYKKKKKTPEKLTINIKDSSGKDTYNIGNIYK